MTQMTRRGFLKALTKVAVSVAAAPAVLHLEELLPVPVDMLDQAEAIGSLRSFGELLNEYLSSELLMAELMKPNWLLERVKKGGLGD